MKPTEQEIEQEANIAVIKRNNKSLSEMRAFSSELESASGYHSGFKDGYRKAISQMQPEWVAVNSVADLPTKEGKYFTYCKVDWHPFYRIDTFHGRLSNAVHHITGKPIYSHYMELVLPQPPTK